MHPYIVNLIIVMVIGIIIAIINDIIVKKNRNGKIDKDKISDTERDLDKNKKENMDNYQRNITQMGSSGFG